MRSLLVVFDIDETLIHFVNKVSSMDPQIRAEIMRLQSRGILAHDIKGNTILFRPYIQELFAFFHKNRELIRVALWTYSDREYAQGIASEIIQLCHLPEDFFVFIYGVEDMVDEDYPKKLNDIWTKFPQFNTFNTFLVDDRAANLTHAFNIMNSIIIQPFDPFGVEKHRTIQTESHVNKCIKDKQFIVLRDICKKLMEDIEGCSDEDIECAFRTEPLFLPKRVARTRLTPYYKEYTYKGKNVIRLMTLGKAEKTKQFTRTRRSRSKAAAVTRRSKSRSRSRSRSKSRSKSRSSSSSSSSSSSTE